MHIYGCRPTWTRSTRSPKAQSLVGGRSGWLAEWRGKKCGTLQSGLLQLPELQAHTCGEGASWATTGGDEPAFSYHDRPYNEPPSAPGIVRLGTKCRMTEFQAAILRQMKRLEEQSNQTLGGPCLTEKIREIPGIVVHKLYDGSRGRPTTLSVPILRGEVRQRSAKFSPRPLRRGPVFRGYSPLNQHRSSRTR